MSGSAGAGFLLFYHMGAAVVQAALKNLEPAGIAAGACSQKVYSL